MWGGGGRGGERVKARLRADTARKRPERPWTAARTMEVLRRCPLAIAQRLVQCAIAVSIAVLGRVTRTMSVANSKHWFTTSFLGGRCRKAMLGVCVHYTADEEQPEAKEV